MIDQHPEEAPADQAQANEPQAEDGPTRARDRVPLFIRRLDWKLIGTILAIKALFYWYGTQAYQVLTNSSIGSFKNWLGLWNRWDAFNYVTLAENGYQATGEARFLIVFYPLFPWLTRLAALIFRNYIVSALIVVAIASIAAGLLLKQLVKLDYGAEVGDRAVWFLFIFPGSVALHTPFTESVLLALAIGAFLAARKERWPVAGLFGGLPSFRCIKGLAFIPALVVCDVYIDFVVRRYVTRWYLA